MRKTTRALDGVFILKFSPSSQVVPHRVVIHVFAGVSVRSLSLFLSHKVWMRNTYLKSNFPAKAIFSNMPG